MRWFPSKTLNEDSSAESEEEAGEEVTDDEEALVGLRTTKGSVFF
jgi:hypothetical protein